MIEIAIAATGLIGFGAGVMAAMMDARRKVCTEHAPAQAWREQRDEAVSYLIALRRNCFLTNERGHRVRYSKASAKVRAKAEGLTN